MQAGGIRNRNGGMKKRDYIGIIAPERDPLISNLRLDFTAKINRKELTLEYLDSLFMYQYRVEDIPEKRKVNIYPVTGAGIYLTGYIRSCGYDTFLVSSTEESGLYEYSQCNPFAVCISTTMIMFQNTLQTMCKNVRNIFPGAKIILGGTWVWKSYLWHRETDKCNTTPASQLIDFSTITYNEVPADVFVISPSGVSLLESVLQCFRTGNTSRLSKIPNLGLFTEKGEFYFTTEENKGIHCDPMITRWDLIDTVPIRIPVRSSFGCSYKCHYCDYQKIFPAFHSRSKESLKREFALLKEKIKASSYSHIIDFIDDNVFFSSHRVKEFCDVLIQSELDLPWIGPMAASSITEENIELLQKSKMKNAFIGLESGDREQLARMNKQQNLEKMKQGITLLEKAGIFKIISLIAGFPGETEKTLLNTAYFLKSLQLELGEYFIFPLYVSPLSPLSGEALRSKWKLKGVYGSWEHLTMSSKDVINAGYTIFKQIPSLPYYYKNRNPYFWSFFNNKSRKQIFHLRHTLTCQILEKKPWNEIAHSLSQLAEVMGYTDSYPPLRVKQYISTQPFKDVHQPVLFENNT